jgi:hypothetical protein
MPTPAKVVIAKVEELEKVCPGNALVWEFLQMKGLCRGELATRIQVMFKRQYDCKCNPRYVQQVHRDGYNLMYRRKIIELYLEVRVKFTYPQKNCPFTHPSFFFQLNLASETIGVAVNLLDRFLALGSRKIADVKLIAVATLVVASKLHGRTLTAKQLIESGVTSFTAHDVAKMELVLCMNLSWNVSPVTPYEIMKHLLLYSAADGETLKNLILQSQIFIDYAMCEYTTLIYCPAAIAMAGIFAAHKATNHCPKQWLQAIRELNLFPAESKEVRSCCSSMHHLFGFSGIDLPPRPTKAAATTPSGAAPRAPPSVSPQNPQDKRKVVAKKIVVDKKAPAGGSLKRAPIKFHSAPEGTGPPLKRPRAISVVESPVD